MVCLHKYFETANGIYLLLEHARGGLLWDYLSSYHLANEDSEFSGCRNKFHDFTDKKEVVHCTASSNGTSSSSSSLEHQESEETCEIEGQAGSGQLDGIQEIELKETRKIDGDSDEKVRSCSTCTGICNCSVDSETSKQNQSTPLSSSQLSKGDALVTDRKFSGDDRVHVLQSESDTNVVTCGKTLVSGKSNELDGTVRETESKNAETRNLSSYKSSLFAKLDEYFSSSNKKLSEDQIRCWIAEIVVSLSHLHAYGIVCRLVTCLRITESTLFVESVLQRKEIF